MCKVITVHRNTRSMATATNGMSCPRILRNLVDAATVARLAI